MDEGGDDTIESSYEKVPSTQEIDPMIQTLKHHFDTHGTWAVKPGESWNGSRVDVWLNLRQQEFGKLRAGGVLKDQKRARLKQLAAVGYDFGVNRGDQVLESLLDKSDADKKAVVASVSYRSLPRTCPSIAESSPSRHLAGQCSDADGAVSSEAEPLVEDQSPVSKTREDFFHVRDKSHSTQEARHCSGDGTGDDETASPVIADDDPASNVVSFKTREEFIRTRDKLLDDLDQAILGAEWKVVLEGVDHSIKQAELLRVAGMKMAQKRAVLIVSEDDCPLYQHSLAYTGVTSENAQVFCVPSDCVSGVVAGSVEGHDTVRASIQVPKHLRVGADNIAITAEDVKVLVSTFKADSFSTRAQRSEFAVIVSDPLAETISCTLAILGPKCLVDAFRTHFSSWVLAYSESKNAAMNATAICQDTAPSKMQEYWNFREKYDRVVTFEFSRSIHKNKVLGYMWKKHKALVGDSCGETCECLHRMPDMLDGFVESLAEEEHRLLTRLGFMTNFSERFLEELCEEHPNDSPKELLNRLLKLYQTEPSLRRAANYHKQSKTTATTDVLQVRIPRKRDPVELEASRISLSGSEVFSSGSSALEPIQLKIPRKRKLEDKIVENAFPLTAGTVAQVPGAPRQKAGPDTLQRASLLASTSKSPQSSKVTLPTAVDRNIRHKMNSDRIKTSIDVGESSWNARKKQKTAHYQSDSQTQVKVYSKSVSSAATFPKRAKFSSDSGQRDSVSVAKNSKPPTFFARLLQRASSDNRNESIQSPTRDDSFDQPFSTSGTKRKESDIDVSKTKVSVFRGSQLDVPCASNDQTRKESVPLPRREGAVGIKQAIVLLSQQRTPRSILRPPNAPTGYRGTRRVQISDADDEVFEFCRTEKVNSARQDRTAQMIEDERLRGTSAVEFATLVRQGSLNDLLKAIKGGSSFNLSRKDLLDLRADISKSDLDQDLLVKKQNIMDIFLLAEEAISLSETHKSWDTSCMLSLTLGEIHLQGKALEPNATIKVTVVEHDRDEKWSRLLERHAPLSSRVVFDDGERFVCRYSKQTLEERTLVIRLKTLRNVRGDNGLYLGAGEIRLKDAYDFCRGKCPDDWHDFHVKVSPHHYELGGAVIETGGRVIVRLKVRDIEDHAARLIRAAVDQIHLLNNALEVCSAVTVHEPDGLKLTGDIVVAKSSLLHAAIATTDIELVVKLMQLGAKPFVEVPSRGSAIAFATTLALAASKEVGSGRERLEAIVQILSSMSPPTDMSLPQSFMTMDGLVEASNPGVYSRNTVNSDQIEVLDRTKTSHRTTYGDEMTANAVTTELPQIAQKMWMMPEYWVRWICREGETCKRGFGACTFIHVHPSVLSHLISSSPHQHSLTPGEFVARTKTMCKPNSVGRLWYTSAYTTAKGQRVTEQEIILVEGGKGRQNMDGIWWYESEEDTLAALEHCVAASFSLRRDHPNHQSCLTAPRRL